MATAAARRKTDIRDTSTAARERWEVGDCVADLERQMLRWWQERAEASHGGLVGLGNK